MKKVNNQDSFYNNSFKQPNNETLNLELDTIKPICKVAQNDPLKSNIKGKDYLGLSIQDLSMIHFEEQSRLGLLKTIKSEIEDEEEESIVIDRGRYQ